MRFLHCSDLHIGKRVHEFSMLDDQVYILNEIWEIAAAKKVDSVLISGDVYDRAVPPTEAVRAFESFLDRLVELGLSVFLISGNHDSSDRLAFGSRWMERRGVYIARPFADVPAPPERISVQDEHGEVAVYLLPYIRPSEVRNRYPEAKIDSWTDAVRTVLEHVESRPKERSVLLAHQFVTGAETGGSEELMVGGAENVDADVFAAFDYVALGHLHRPQSVSRQTIRYSGSPLKYSFSESNHRKSVVIVEMGPLAEEPPYKEGMIRIETVPLVPFRDMLVLRHSYDKLMSRSFYSGINPENYYKIILTDAYEQPDVIRKLRIVYPNIMSIEYENRRSPGAAFVSAPAADRRETPLELFEQLYLQQHGGHMSDVQRAYMRTVIEDVFDRGGEP